MTEIPKLSELPSTRMLVRDTIDQNWQERCVVYQRYDGDVVDKQGVRWYMCKPIPKNTRRKATRNEWLAAVAHGKFKGCVVHFNGLEKFLPEADMYDGEIEAYQFAPITPEGEIGEWDYFWIEEATE